MNIRSYDQKEHDEIWLKKRNPKAFYQPIVAPTVRQGTMALLQVNSMHDHRIEWVSSSVLVWAKCVRILFFLDLKMIGWSKLIQQMIISILFMMHSI